MVIMWFRSSGNIQPNASGPSDYYVIFSPFKIFEKPIHKTFLKRNAEGLTTALEPRPLVAAAAGGPDEPSLPFLVSSFSLAPGVVTVVSLSSAL